jgi:nucleoside-triphosphatase
MSKPTLKLFVTGDPACGKTTLIRTVVERLAGSVTMTGFYTEEIRERGRRRGFRGTTLDGRSFVLADRASPSDLRVGPYGVEVTQLETIGLPALEPRPETGLVVLDEVGKMELLSERFRSRVEALLAGDTPLLGTVASHGVGFVKRLRRDPRITLLRMRREAREAMLGEVLRLLKGAGR